MPPGPFFLAEATDLPRAVGILFAVKDRQRREKEPHGPLLRVKE
jgi:hypothetical protein